MTSAENKAVFLSYASQDAEAVRRIAETLRASGVEVWFDQNELVGGDAWDQKIRGQIASCALFVPVISAATQARREGYFRLEWKLAAQRTHMMSERQAFLLPVVIDGTRDAEADVPVEFRAVQWTRLPEGEGAEKFCARVGRLLGRQGGTVGPADDRAPDHRPGLPPARRPARPWLGPAILGATAVVALAVWQPWRATEKLTPPASSASTAAPLTEARKLVAQARTLFIDGDQSNHEIFFLADDLLKQALALDPADGEVWAAQAQVSAQVYYVAYDRSSARRETMRVQAERAVKLAPESFEAQLAMAMYLALAGASTAPEAVPLLNRLAERAPNDRRVYQTLGAAYYFDGKMDDAMLAFRRSNAVPGGDPEGLGLLAAQFFWHGRYAEMGEAIAQSLAIRPVGRALIHDVNYKLVWLGDLDAAAAALGRWPAWLLREDRGAFLASQVWMWRREPDKAVEALNRLTRDFINESLFLGPKAGLLALAHEMANRPQAARTEWVNARNAAGRVVAEDPANKRALAWKGIALARLGETKEAGVILDELEQLKELRADFWSCGAGGALLRIAVGRGDEVAAKFDSGPRSYAVRLPLPTPQAALRLNPVFDPIRDTPAFQTWMAAAPAPKMRTASEAASKSDDKSVAVLAFANQSDDKANEYFSDGISEELLNVLAKVPGLKVTARTSAFHFKGKDTPIPEIARQLGVAYVIEGSVRKAGDKVRITAQLIKAADGFHVWSDTFTRDLKDVFAVQDEIAGIIAKQLSLKLGASSATAMATVSPEALELYVQARQAWNLRTSAGFDRAEELLNRALVLSPGFARAHAALADVWNTRGWLTGEISVFGRRNSALQQRVLARIQRALELDGDCAEAHAALGGAAWSRWEIPKAERELRRAIELNPNYASAHQWLGRVLMMQGKVEEALPALKRATELDPFAARIFDNYAMQLAQAGQLAEARVVGARGLEIQPGAASLSSYQASILRRLGAPAAADALLRSIQEINEGGSAWWRVWLLALGGWPKEAAVQLPSLDPQTDDVALILAYLGRTDEALAALNPETVQVTILDQWLYQPAVDPMRGDPRFGKFLATLGVTEAHARAQAWRKAHPPETVEPKK